MPGAGPFLDAFFELSTDRHIGPHLGPIPFSAVDRYGARFGFHDLDEFQVLLAAIRAMDGEFLHLMHSKQTGRPTA